jgi:hypothetical protein
VDRFICTTKQRKQIRQITMDYNDCDEEENGGSSNDDGEVERDMIIVPDLCRTHCVDCTSKIAHFVSLCNHHFQSSFFSAFQIISNIHTNTKLNGNKSKGGT